MLTLPGSFTARTAICKHPVGKRNSLVDPAGSNAQVLGSATGSFPTLKYTLVWDIIKTLPRISLGVA